MQWLPNKNYDELFKSLLENRLVPLIENEMLVPLDLDQHQDIDATTAKTMLIAALQSLDGIVHLCSLAIVDKKSNVPEIEETQIFAKDVLTRLAKMYAKLANDISLVCELWFKQERPSREHLVPQTLPYLLQRAYASTVIADITRLNGMRAGLTLLDFADESTESVRELLLACFLQPQFIKTAEGRKLLVSLFSIRPAFVDDIHQVVKAQLLSCGQSILNAYADIYFKAWHVASGAFIVRIEFGCLQNLATCALHCKDPKLLKSLLLFLGHFHRQKVTRGVDAMLVRVYEAILWRSLRAANPSVRVNAVKLFTDAFPLHDADAAQPEVDALMQRQFSTLDELLFDPSVSVRVAAVQGTIGVLARYWQIIPVATSRSLLAKIINQLAFDKAAVQVREAVFIGLRFLLDSNLSHATLKVLLPHLAPLIHDNSESVRGAFLDLLLDLKNISTIRFLDVVKLEHLLERMVIDYRNVKLTKKLTQLLVEAYFPHESERSSEMVERCLSLVKSKKNATLAFYSNLINFVPLISIAKFLTLSFRFIISNIAETPDISAMPRDADLAANKTKDNKTLTKSKQKKPRGKKSAAKPVDDAAADQQDDDAAAEEEEDQDEDVVTLENIETLLEVIGLGLESIRAQIHLPENLFIMNGLLSKINDESLIGLYIWLFSGATPRIASMCQVVQIASIFGQDNFPSFGQVLIQNFQEIDMTTPDKLKETLLLCLFAWTPNAVVDFLHIEINEPIELAAKLGARGKRKTPDYGDDDDVVTEMIQVALAKANVALIFYDMIMRHKTTREWMVENTEEIAKLITSLMGYMPLIESKMSHECGIQVDDAAQVALLPHVDNKLLLSSFMMLGKCLFHIAGSQEKIEKDTGAFQGIFDWGKDVLMPAAESYVQYKIPRSQKRKWQEEAEDDPMDEEEDNNDDNGEIAHPLVLDITHTFLLILTENLSLGFCGDTTVFELCKIVKALVELTRGIRVFGTLVPTIAKFAYQVDHVTVDDQTLQTASHELIVFLLAGIDDRYEASEKPLSVFRLQDILAHHHQRGCLAHLIRILMVPVQAEIAASVESNASPRLITCLSELSPSSNFICSSIGRSASSVAGLAEYIAAYIKSESMRGTDHSPLQNLLMNFISKLPHLSKSDDSDDEQDSSMLAETTTNQFSVTYTKLLEMSNQLFNDICLTREINYGVHPIVDIDFHKRARLDRRCMACLPCLAKVISEQKCAVHREAMTCAFCIEIRSKRKNGRICKQLRRRLNTPTFAPPMGEHPQFHTSFMISKHLNDVRYL
eukprot:gene5968-6912_t